MRMFRTVHHLRNSKVLVGAATPAGRQPSADAYHEHFGTTFKFVTGPEFKDAFDAVGREKAQKAPDEFTRGALRVVEATPKEILDGLRFYLALEEMMKREKANAVTIDCFGSLAANTLPGYPCIAWSKLNDVGLYGVCEGDLASTMTQILVTSYHRHARLRLRSGLRHQPQRSDSRALRVGDEDERDQRSLLPVHRPQPPGDQRRRGGAGADAVQRDHHRGPLHRAHSGC